MQKYHVGSDGVPKLCTATRRPCPLGGEHFESKIEAEKYAEEKLSQEFGSLPSSQTKMIDVVCEFGTIRVKDGDLTDASTRMTLVNGLCGDVASAIQKKTGGNVFFVTYDGLNSEQLEENFKNDSESLLNTTTHVMIESPTQEGKYVDAYGQKSLDEIRAFYGEEINMVKGTDEMLQVYTTGQNDLSNFADSALLLDRNSEGYSYTDYGS